LIEHHHALDIARIPLGHDALDRSVQQLRAISRRYHDRHGRPRIVPRRVPLLDLMTIGHR
jgi:hypothetical protein